MEALVVHTLDVMLWWGTDRESSRKGDLLRGEERFRG